MSCRSSPLWNKAKRFPNMSATLVARTKIGIIQQTDIPCELLICKNSHFLCFGNQKHQNTVLYPTFKKKGTTYLATQSNKKISGYYLSHHD